MTKRTKPDKNQADIEEAINMSPGCSVIDTHNVPANLPELTGFPDGLITNEHALTVICNDPIAVAEILRESVGVVAVIQGGIIPVEIKTESGKLSPSQIAWAQKYGIAQVVLRTIDDVFQILGTSIF